jgi:membrane protein
VIDRFLCALLGPELPGKLGRLSTTAAALAFYSVLAMVPFLIVSVTFIEKFLPADFALHLEGVLADFLPPDSKIDPVVLLDTVQKLSSRGMLTLGFILALWTASGFILELVHGLQYLFSADPHMVQITWTQRIKAVLLLLIWVLTLFVSLFILILMPGLEALTLQLDPLGGLVRFAWGMAHYMVAFVLLLFAIDLTYRFSADRKIPGLLIHQGAVIASLSWVILSFIFVDVLPHIWEPSPVHGALSSIVSTLLWAYAGNWAILAGGMWIVRQLSIREKKAAANAAG